MMRESKIESWYNFQSEQEQLYNYLLMRFCQVYREGGRRRFEQCPQLKQQVRSCINNSTVLDLCFGNIQNSGANPSPKQPNISELDKYTQQAKRIVLVNELIHNYPLIFSSKQICSFSLQTILFQAIKKCSLMALFGYLAQRQQDNSLQFFYEQLGPELEFLILAVTISNKLTFKSYSILQIHKELQSALLHAVNKAQHSPEIKTKVSTILIQYLATIFSTSSRKSSPELNEQLNNEYMNFKLRFTTSQTDVNSNILKLHYIGQLVSQFKKQPYLNLTNINQHTLSSALHNQSLKTINLFTSINQGCTQHILINQVLINNYLKQPYQTSLFVLFKLLSNSQIQNIDNIFTFNSKQLKIIDPLAFLLVDTKLINVMNAESFSLSLWIIMEVWLKNATPKKQKPATAFQQETLPQQNVLKIDPRRIYSIKKDSYPALSTSVEKGQMKQSNKNPQECMDFSKQYKRPMIYTILMFLLTLQVQTTILKYLPIENEIMRQMIEGDLLPTLLIQNQFLFEKQTQSSPLSIRSQRLNTQHKQSMSKQEKELMQKIQSAQTIQEIQHLQCYLARRQQMSLQGPSKQSSDNPEIFSNQFGRWALPWMCIIQTKGILSTLMRKPRGCQLALKLIERRPNTFFKIYDRSLLQLIFDELKQKLAHQNQIKKRKATNNSYQFKGNLNTPLKKHIDYDNDGVRSIQFKKRQLNNGVQNKQEEEQKREAIKQILQIYQRNSPAQYTQQICQVSEQILQAI